MSSPLPVLIVAGFLGAGKTTALRQLIQRNQGRKLGVIVNDFASLNIDADMVRSVHSDVVALDNGCICCSIRDELPEAIERLLGSGPIDAIYIETSGVSLPQKIVASLRDSRVAGRVRVFGVYCVVDSHAFGDMSYTDTELAIDQAAAADLVVLNKIDIATTAQLEDVRRTIASACPHASFVTATNGLPASSEWLDFDTFAGTEEFALPSGAEHTKTHIEFETFTWKSHDALELDEIRQMIGGLPAHVVRAKGMFYPADRGDAVAIFNKVGNRSTLDLLDREPQVSDSTRHQFVAIAHKSELDLELMNRVFAKSFSFVAI